MAEYTPKNRNQYLSTLVGGGSTILKRSPQYLGAVNAPAVGEYLTSFAEGLGTRGGDAVMGRGASRGILGSIADSHRDALAHTQKGFFRFNWGGLDSPIFTSILGSTLLGKVTKKAHPLVNFLGTLGGGAGGYYTGGFTGLAQGYTDQNEVGNPNANPIGVPIEQDVNGKQGGQSPQMSTGGSAMQGKKSQSDDLIAQSQQRIASIVDAVAQQMPEETGVVDGEESKLSRLEREKASLQRTRTEELMSEIESEYEFNKREIERQRVRQTGILLARQARAGTLGTADSADSQRQGLESSFDAKLAQEFNRYVNETMDVIYKQGEDLLNREIKLEKEAMAEKNESVKAYQTKIEEVRKSAKTSIEEYAEGFASLPDQSFGIEHFEAFESYIETIGKHLTLEEIEEAKLQGLTKGNINRVTTINKYRQGKDYATRRDTLNNLLRSEGATDDEVRQVLAVFEQQVAQGGSSAGNKYLLENFGPLFAREFERKKKSGEESIGYDVGAAQQNLDARKASEV